MDVALYTGTGSSQAITGLEFSPDFVWIKNRASGGSSHALFDIVRGADKRLRSNGADAELSPAIYGTLSSFDSNGFTVAPGSSDDIETCNLNDTYVGWTWDAGSSTVSNTDGSITSSVRANPSAGFSIVSYTGTSANATVGHGLGVTPSLLIVKNSDGVYNWRVWHKQLSSTEVLWLNTTDAVQTGQTTMWNSTLPSSTVFNLGTNAGVNLSTNNYVAYCFAPVDGYSSFGSYVGNGSTDGPFVYTGFRPRWLMIKESSAGDDPGHWMIIDTARSVGNQANNRLHADLSNSEYANSGPDILSNGFKLRNESAIGNFSGVTYIYAAFAEHPFQYARAR
jgi:hypothetical protein